MSAWTLLIYQDFALSEYTLLLYSAAECWPEWRDVA
jgi:hypothetical protein